MPEDFYDLLEVSPDADESEIKQAYRAKVREYHPDQNPDERATDQFKAIRRGYEVLTDPEERQAYDRMGHETYVAKRMDGLPTHGSSGGGGGTSEGSGPRSRDRGRRSRDRGRDGGETESRRRDGSRYGGGETFARQRRRQRASRRRRRLAAEAAAVVATAVYLAGLAVFLRASGGVEALVSRPMADSAAVGLDPAAFARGADGVDLLFPVGAALFPIGVAAAALRERRRLGVAATVAALGPAVGVAASAAGTVPVVALALCLAVAPVLAIAALAVVAARRR